jgi:hypothetical protein
MMEIVRNKLVIGHATMMEAREAMMAENDLVRRPAKLTTG